MIGRFPWEPFPAGAPDPKGADPLPLLVYRSAVTGADAYRSVRLALRREDGVLRVGNRFVPEGRYREVAFVAAGNAANSMALAALSVLDETVTQGFLAGPEAVPPEIPFRGVRIEPGWGGAPDASAVVGAVREISERLRDSDLLLLLLSPGALRALSTPPPGLTADELSSFLEAAHERGAGGREVGLVARVLGNTPLVPPIAADVETLAVERGDGAAHVGGGPTVPVRSTERVEARAALERLGLLAGLPESARDRLSPGFGHGATDAATARRPVVVAGPPDALRAAADVTFEKGWTARLAALEIRDRPTPAADRFLELVESLARTERTGEGGRSKGLAAFAMLTLDRPEGTDEGPALVQFLEEAQRALRRREMSVGLLRTSGTIGSPSMPAGGVVGAPSDPEAGTVPPRRALPMRPGITDVGLLAVAVLPEHPSGTSTPPAAARRAT